MNAYVAGVDTQEAQNETLAGLADSLAKVGGFAGSTAMPSTDSESYTNGFISDWTAAGTAEKANLWAKQYWISLYGNGTNAYNTYRKTGLPTDVQPNIEPSPGAFPVSMWYPNSFVSRNQTATQKTALTGQVFWNTNGPTNLK
jgi:hypothetical protein